MENTFDQGLCLAYLKKGRLRSAMEYLAQFPEQAELCRRCTSLFQQENYLSYDVDGSLQDILLAYQKYYRDAFYLEQRPEEAAERLRARLAGLLPADCGAALDELEERAAEAFRAGGLHFLGGRTGGWYGPYIWRTEELKRYTVELPDGVQEYAVKLLDGFVMESWLSYLTFGMSGTGGWSNGDGLIHCVRRHYDPDSESFQVSLLKHEAQHASDQGRYPGMSSEDLEYRAKLVELIYSEERNMMTRFDGEADAAKKSDGHALASSRIVEGFAACLGPGGALDALSIKDIQAIAGRLFAESARDVAGKYPARTDVEQGAL